MAEMEAWRIDREIGEDADSQRLVTSRLAPSHIEREKHLEDWIVKDPTLIGEGLTLVGRQVQIDDGILDLLAIDRQGRWVVIELKAGRLGDYALTQALRYASSVALIDNDELRRKLEPGLGDLGDAQHLDSQNLKAMVRQQCETDEEGEHEVAVLLVGAGIHPRLERMEEFLGRFDVPIDIVNFGVFELKNGPRMLVRKAIEAPPESSPSRPRFTVEGVRSLAASLGVGGQFDRFVKMAEDADLYAKANRNQLSVTIAPPNARNRFLMYAMPLSKGGDGNLWIEVGPQAFKDFYKADPKEVIDLLGTAVVDKPEKAAASVCANGKALDEILARIEHFLNEKVKPPDAEQA